MLFLTKYSSISKHLVCSRTIGNESLLTAIDNSISSFENNSFNYEWTQHDSVSASIQGQDIAEAYLAEQSLRRSRNLSLRPTPFPDRLLLLKGQVF